MMADMRLVLEVSPPFRTTRSNAAGAAIESPIAQVEVGPLCHPAADPDQSVAQVLTQLTTPNLTAQVVVDKQQRSLHGWPIRLLRVHLRPTDLTAPAATGVPSPSGQVVIVYYHCLGHSAQVVARLTPTPDRRPLGELPAELQSLLLSGRPDFRSPRRGIDSLYEIWDAQDPGPSD